MDEYINKSDVISLIKEQQRKLCHLGRFSRRYLYGTDREKFDYWQEIIDLVDRLPVLEVQNETD